MALKKDYNKKTVYITEQTRFSNTDNCYIKEEIINDCYIVVENLTGSKSNVNFSVVIYKTSDKSEVIDSKLYSFIPNVEENSSNFIKQCYNYLKTLPEYADAIDVLEEGQSL